MQKWLLSEVAQTESETEIINGINKELSTKLIIPITYNSDEDLILSQFMNQELLIYEVDPRYPF